MMGQELKNVHKGKEGKLTICVKDQNDVFLAYIAVDVNEYEELKRTSQLGWCHYNINHPNLKNVAFLAIWRKMKTGTKMISSCCSNLLQLIFLYMS